MSSKSQTLAYKRQKVKETYARKRIYVYAFKKEKGCAMCGEKDPVVLDLHHRIGTKKNRKLRAGKNKKLNRTFEYLAWAELDTELDKCDVLCANCHRRTHRMLEAT